MTPPEFTVPAHVEQNAERRGHADQVRDEQRRLSAELRRLRGTPDPPVPDSTRTLRALRERAGLRTDPTPAFRTVSDERAESKGQRVSSARRAVARGDDQ